MEIKDYEPQAWTPELGGDFGDFQLLLTPFLFEERQTYIQNNTKGLKVKRDEAGNMEFDAAFLRAGVDLNILDRIVEWKNLYFHGTTNPVKCNKESKKKYILQLLGKKTGFHYKDSEGNETENFMTLYDYIDWFTGEIESFQKN